VSSAARAFCAKMNTSRLVSFFSEEQKVDLLLALCCKKKPLSASDVAAIQQLLAAGAGVANGRGKNE
jgi:hypothetical protein